MKKKEEMQKTYIPTIEEMQNLYEENLRKISKISLDKKEDFEVSSEGEFFKKFRKFEKDISEEIDENTNNIYYEKYKDFIENEIITQGEKVEDLINLINYEKFFLNWERKVNEKSKNFTSYGSTKATRYHVDKIIELENELENLLNTSPEAWQYYNKKQLYIDIENSRKHKLVDVDYVKRSKGKIIESLNLGVPVYLVGHLGSGKTQLATEAAIEFTVKNKIQYSLEEKMENWFKNNKSATEEEVIKIFKEFNEELINHYKNILEKGEKSEIEKLQPLFISGSHNLTYEDMFVEKTLTLEHSFSKGSYGDYLELIIDDFYFWMDSHKEKLNKLSNEEQLNLKIQIWKSFSDLLVASNSAFGTEIKKIEREILIAVREGRTVIVDELNTIAMQNLIALNDILQKHIGDRAYVTGVGAVEIKEGFGFIGTGNLSTQRVNYEGTNELNPAFKSRFLTIEYNYVSQNIIGSLDEQENVKSNELFRIMITRIADKDGNIQIPNAKRTLEELFRFAQLSKVTQNVFMGKWKDNIFEDESDVEELELRESVLSIRNIIHVLDNWNNGEEKDLSKALWDGFISSITYPDDQNYIISQAIRFGFFKESEGWNIKVKSLGDSTTSYEEIRNTKYIYHRQNIENLSYLDTMHLIYGNSPKRKTLPKELKKSFKENIDNNLRINIEKYEELDKKLNHLEHSINLLDYIEDGNIENEK